jgi:hypothetical protein
MTIRAQTGPGHIAERVRPRPLPSPLDSPTLPDLHTLATQTAALLWIDDARDAGLIEAEIAVDRLACRDVLERAWRNGIVVDVEQATDAALQLMAELGVLRS